MNCSIFSGWREPISERPSNFVQVGQEDSGHAAEKGVRRVAFALGKTGMRRLVGLRTGGRTGAAPLACAAVLTSVACLTTCS